nr:ABC transporter ATP-binding protein [Halobiforma nitratireducens]
MEDLSLGQKGTVLLKILLAQDEKPLIIDQPEENLDNRFIYKTLKDAFKEAKKKRQVIIATHNANLVVNTDAEQVVVANYEENEISFTAGPLEDSEIREEVTTILEGGEQAFIQREEKYGLAE